MNFGQKTTPNRAFSLRSAKRRSLHSPIDPYNRINSKIEIDQRGNDFDVNVNFYAVPPLDTVKLNDADNLVQERLNILRVFSDLRADASVMRSNSTYFRILNERLKSVNDGANFLVEGLGGRGNAKVMAARRRDHVSHFLLRLYCCRNEESRRWFIQQETELLRFRLFDESNKVDLPRFLEHNNLVYECADEQLKTQLTKLGILQPAQLRRSNNQLYKIPFEEALDMVRTRRAYLEDGYCYVLGQDMITIICMRFKVELSHALANMAAHLPYVEEDKRLLPRINALYQQSVAANKEAKQLANSASGEHIIPEMIDELAQKFFPPCMRNMHEQLRTNHHLRHYGRLHYSLFLKSIGLKMEDALQFFRDEFVLKMTPERFQREHAYNIRYNYGKEGKRVEMSAYSCAKILNENAPGAGDSHGCPFKHFDESNLVQLLRKHQINEEGINGIMELVRSKNYTNACTNYFSCRMPNYGLSERGIYHPSQYYVESRKAASGSCGTAEIVKEEAPSSPTSNEDPASQFDDDDDAMFNNLSEADISQMIAEAEASSQADPIIETKDSDKLSEENIQLNTVKLESVCEMEQDIIVPQQFKSLEKLNVTTKEVNMEE